MPEFDLDTALQPAPPFSVAPVPFSSGGECNYILFTPEDGTEPFRTTWFSNQAEAERACQRANRKHLQKPYPYQRVHGGVVLKLPDFDRWLRT